MIRSDGEEAAACAENEKMSKQKSMMKPQRNITFNEDTPLCRYLTKSTLTNRH